MFLTRIKMLCAAFILAMGASAVSAQTGPFSPAADSAGSDAIHKDSVIVVGWATGASVQRGFQDISQAGPLASVGDSTLVAGPADGAVVSLGDSGVAVVTFAAPLANHPGVDFAVFENGLYDMANGGYFLELAFVEVSSDGVHFYRFPNTSLTDTSQQTGPFGVTDPTNIDGLAGKYIAGYGVPFDLIEMEQISGLDIMHITHIRIVDVVGSLLEAYTQLDMQGHKINDPWPTDFASSGFDLDAIALIDQQVLSVVENKTVSGVAVYPNPVNNILVISTLNLENENKFRIFNPLGAVMIDGTLRGKKTRVDVGRLASGIYFLKVGDNAPVSIIKK